MKTRYYRLICLLAICGLFFLYRPTSLYAAQPSVNLTMPKTNLIPGNSLVLDLEMKAGTTTNDLDLYLSISIEPDISTFYLDQTLNFVKDKVPVISNFKPFDFKVRIFGPGFDLLPSIFGEFIIPPGITGTFFLWTVEVIAPRINKTLSIRQIRYYRKS